MPTHPNRGRPSGASNPAPEAIKALRLSLGLSQTAFGALVHAGLRTVQDWEAGDRRMHPGLWELARLKGGQIKLHDNFKAYIGTEYTKAEADLLRARQRATEINALQLLEVAKQRDPR